MSLSDPAHRASLGARVRGVLLRPASEWDRIALEPATIRSLFTGYAMPLAAIGPVCSAIGSLLFGRLHPDPVFVLVFAGVSYVLTLAATFLIGLVIEALAPTFGGVKDRVQAMKVAVYGSTASWLARIFGLVPLLALLTILGLYSLYLYYVGLPRVMRTGEDKALGYTALVVVCYVGLLLVIGLVTAPLLFMGVAARGGFHG